MRIVISLLHLTSDNLGGSWTYSYNLLRGLQYLSKSDEINVLVNQNALSLFSDIHLKIIPIPINAESRVRRVAWEQFYLFRFLKKLAPDVLHATGNTLPLGSTCPTVVTVHDFQYRYFPENFTFPRRNYLRIMAPMALRIASKVICVSNDTKQDAITLGKIKEEKITVIYEAGLWKEELCQATESSMLKQRYNISSPILLSVGSLYPHKNLSRLIQSYAMISDQIPHDLVIIGDPQLMGPILRKIILCEMRGKDLERVKVTGFINRNDLLGFYCMADAFVFPSLFEGFGIPALEAMECGCPVIAAQARALPEIIDCAGKYFDPLNILDMADAIKQVALDMKLQKNLSELGYARAKQFSWIKMAEETYKIYESLVGME